MAQPKILSIHQKRFDHPLSSIMRQDFDTEPIFNTENGILFEGDCLELLPYIENETINTVFADPPFNLKKRYGINVNDDLLPEKYLSWCRQWIHQCTRVLKKGGAFLYTIFLTDV